MKNKNLIYWIVGILLLVIIFMLFAGNDRNKNTSEAPTINTSTYSESELSVMENNFDFGTISMKDGVVSYEVEIVNSGTESVKIGRVFTSCACTTAYIIADSGEKIGKFGMPGHKGLRASADMEVPAGESVKVEVIYDPALHGPSGVGLAQRSVYIETNSKVAPRLELKFQAMVAR